jgi:hypothetical protein
MCVCACRALARAVWPQASLPRAVRKKNTQSPCISAHSPAPNLLFRELSIAWINISDGRFECLFCFCFVLCVPHRSSGGPERSSFFGFTMPSAHAVWFELLVRTTKRHPPDEPPRFQIISNLDLDSLITWTSPTHARFAELPRCLSCRWCSS